MELLYSATSPFVRKVLVAARERGLADRLKLEPVIVLPTQPNAAVAQNNPLMKIPVLRLEDGTSLYDSPVIIEYFDTLGGAQPIIPIGPRRWPALRRQAVCDGILDAVILCRYELLRPPELRWPPMVDGQMTKMRQGLAALAADLPDIDGSFELDHMCIAITLSYLDFRFAEEPWRGWHPNLAAWYASIARRPSLLETAPPVDG